MDDINFDELDKAVNSALKQAPQSELPTTPSNPTPPSKEGPVAEKPVERSVPKRRGQFMDMVHPSSDMMKTTPAKMNRQGATIQPLDPSIVEAKAEDVKQEEKPVQPPKPTLPEASVEPDAASAESTAVHSEWPDPLDVMEQAEQTKQEERAAEATPTADEAPAKEQGNAALETTPNMPEEPATSPFISGPELEKRPLGAFAGSVTSEDQPSEKPADITEPAPLQESGDTNELPAVPAVPQELAPEVVSVESDSSVQTLNQEFEPEGHEEKGPAEGPAMTASIAQQYKNTDEPSDDHDHPVFDTKEYHQPLQPPVKRGHTGLVVVLIVLLLGALGAGAWYAIFVLKII